MKLGILVTTCLLGLFFGTASYGISANQLNIEPVVVPDAQVMIQPRVVAPGTSATLSYTSPGLEPTQDVFAHFGFNGWNLEFPGSAQDFPMGNLSHYKRIPMEWNSSAERFEAEIAVPGGARAIHFVFCWDQCEVGQWDNNSNQDYGWPIQFPYIGPLLSWDGQTAPENGIVVSFESAIETDAWIEVNERYSAPTRFPSTSSPGSRHSFRLRDLKADTTYYYRVGAGDEFESQQYSFKTPKSHESGDSLSFILMGDAQDDGENQNFALVADSIASQHNDIDFIVSPGDMPWNDRPGDWWAFFDKGREMLASKVFMPAVGNHDSPGNGSNEDTTSFRRYFPALPFQSNELPYYKFSVHDLRFYILSSEHPETMTDRGEQYRWLDRELDQLNSQRHSTQDPATYWSFVMWHIPPYNAGSRHAGQQFSFRDIAQHFNSNVDWFFGGHEHLYQRSHPINFKPFGLERKPRYGDQNGDGTGVLVVPPMGATPNGQLIRNRSRESREILENLAYPDRSEEQVDVESLIGFVRIDIEGEAFNLQTFGLRNTESGRFEVVDSLSYEK